MNPLIYAAMHDEQVKIWPGEFLGPGVFKIYRDLCLNSGCAYVPKLSANLVRLDLLPALLKRLKTAFTVKLGADVLAAAEKRSYAIVSSQEEAKSRVASLKDQPYPFQVKGIEFLASRQTALLGDMMGIGKTIQALLAIRGQENINATRNIPENSESTQSIGSQSGKRPPDRSQDKGDGHNEGAIKIDGLENPSFGCDTESDAPAGSAKKTSGSAKRIQQESSAEFQGRQQSITGPDNSQIARENGGQGLRAGTTNPHERPRDGIQSAGNLQSGFRSPDQENSDRNGRPQPPPNGSQSSRPEKETSAGSLGVASHSYQPQIGSAVLVICPASIKGNWLKEATRWRPDLKSRIIERFEMPVPGEMLIINYERLPDEETLVIHKQHVFLRETIIIADECHYLKSPKSLRTKRFRALAKAVRAAGGFTWGLSGTPMANSPMDLLNVLQAFDLLRDSFGSYPRFCSMFSGKQDYWGKWTWGQPKPGAVEALQRVMLRRLREDVLPDLPTITYQDIEVDVTAAARRASDEARAAMAAAGVDLQMVIDGKATLGAASDSVFTARRMLAEAKIAAMLEIVEEYEGAKEPLIVFSAHRAPIEAVGAHGAAAILGDNSAESRSSIVHDFQSGIGNCIGLTIKSGAVGFTLTRAAHIVMVDQEWTPDWNQQAVSRACRIGQTRGVLVKRLIAPDTIDQDVMRILDEKQRSIDATVDQTQGQSIQATPEELWNIK